MSAPGSLHKLSWDDECEHGGCSERVHGRSGTWGAPRAGNLGDVHRAGRGTADSIPQHPARARRAALRHRSGAVSLRARLGRACSNRPAPCSHPADICAFPTRVQVTSRQACRYSLENQLYTCGARQATLSPFPATASLPHGAYTLPFLARSVPLPPHCSVPVGSRAPIGLPWQPLGFHAVPGCPVVPTLRARGRGGGRPW